MFNHNYHIFTSVPSKTPIIKGIILHVWLIPEKREIYRVPVCIEFVSDCATVGAFCLPASKFWNVRCHLPAQTHWAHRPSKFIFPNGFMPARHKNIQSTTSLLPHLVSICHIRAFIWQNQYPQIITRTKDPLLS